MKKTLTILTIFIITLCCTQIILAGNEVGYMAAALHDAKKFNAKLTPKTQQRRCASPKKIKEQKRSPFSFLKPKYALLH